MRFGRGLRCLAIEIRKFGQHPSSAQLPYGGCANEPKPSGGRGQGGKGRLTCQKGNAAQNRGTIFFSVGTRKENLLQNTSAQLGKKLLRLVKRRSRGKKRGVRGREGRGGDTVTNIEPALGWKGNIGMGKKPSNRGVRTLGGGKGCCGTPVLGRGCKKGPIGEEREGWAVSRRGLRLPKSAVKKKPPPTGEPDQRIFKTGTLSVNFWGGDLENR